MDLGCGNLRDSLFFWRYGRKVLACDCVDIEIPTELRGQDSFAFQRHCFGSDQPQKLMTQVEAMGFRQNWAVYARFLVHALDEGELRSMIEFLGLAADLGATGLIEARAPKQIDTDEPIFSNHSRNFVSLGSLKELLSEFGLEVVQESQSRGVAAFRLEDPLVYRLVVAKNA